MYQVRQYCRRIQSPRTGIQQYMFQCNKKRRDQSYFSGGGGALVVHFYFWISVEKQINSLSIDVCQVIIAKVGYRCLLPYV